MPAFTRNYSRELEDAVASAYEDRRIRPMSRVLELAKAGELREGLPAEEVPMATARGWVQVLRKRRAGDLRSKTAEQPDAVQTLKRRLLAMCDGELTVEERKKPGTRDPERMRQLARALREAAAIPDKGDPRPVRPGDRKPGTGEQDGDTTGGLAGSILAAARGIGNRTGANPQHTHANGDSGSAQHGAHDDETTG